MLPPRALGTITHIAEEGSYTVDVRIYDFLFIIWTLNHTRRILFLKPSSTVEQLNTR